MVSRNVLFAWTPVTLTLQVHLVPFVHFSGLQACYGHSGESLCVLFLVLLILYVRDKKKKKIRILTKECPPQANVVMPPLVRTNHMKIRLETDKVFL